MKKHFGLILVSFLAAFAVSLASLILTQATYGSFNPWELIYLIMLGISCMMLIWSKRIPMHSTAALFIGYVALLLKFLTWGINLSTMSGASALDLTNGILNFVTAFIIFDAAIFSAHGLLKLKSLLPIAKILNYALLGLIAILVITNSINNFSTLTGGALEVFEVIFGQLCLLATAVVPLLSLVLLKDKAA